MKNKMSGKAETRNHFIGHNANGQTLVEFAIVIPPPCRDADCSRNAPWSANGG
jgi:hypothetical protein